MSEDKDFVVSPIQHKAETPLSQTDVFAIIQKLGLTALFRTVAYEDATPEETEFNPDVQMIYRHNLGLKFLRDNRLPATVEDLKSRTEYLFETVKVGKKDYKAGEYIVLIPQPIWNGNDIQGNLIIAKVLEDFTFDGTEDLNSGSEEDFLIAIRPLVEEGKLEIHPEPGLRMFNSYSRWTFESRYKK